MFSLPVTSTKLKLTTCDTDGTTTPESKTFELMLNPEYYSVKSTINYDSDEAAQGITYSREYKNTPPKEISIGPFILDVTGAVPFKLACLNNSIRDMIDELEKVVYNYDGTKHQPNIFWVQWGSNLFMARLETMDVKYTLFAEDGDPLRAEVSLTLMEYLVSKEQAKKDNQQSPDITHLIEVKDGDTLPLMCNRVYKDCSYYREVAEINGLDDFCNLTPGTFLYFPPLID